MMVELVFFIVLCGVIFSSIWILSKISKERLNDKEKIQKYQKELKEKPGKFLKYIEDRKSFEEKAKIFYKDIQDNFDYFDGNLRPKEDYFFVCKNLSVFIRNYIVVFKGKAPTKKEVYYCLLDIETMLPYKYNSISSIISRIKKEKNNKNKNDYQ